MSESNYITCACQHCSEKIKFDANQLGPNETRRIECPHCHLETLVFNKQSKIESEAKIKIDKGLKSSKIELFLFELTRLPMVIGAILIILTVFVVIVLGLKSLTSEQGARLPSISYETVAPIAKTSNDSHSDTTFTPHGAKMSKNSFPQPVVSFLLKHQRFTLKPWLDQLNADQRKAFLENLAKILVVADERNLLDQQQEDMVKDFGDMWITFAHDAESNYEKAILEKQTRIKILMFTAFGLFISLMILSLVLVLLAIERNTRAINKNATKT